MTGDMEIDPRRMLRMSAGIDQEGALLRDLVMAGGPNEFCSWIRMMQRAIEGEGFADISKKDVQVMARYARWAMLHLIGPDATDTLGRRTRRGEGDDR